MSLINLSQVAEVQLKYITRVDIEDMPKITKPTQVYDLLIDDWEDIDLIETFKVVFLNRNDKVLGVKLISKGGTAGCIADAKIIFSAALKIMAHSIVLIHNHPSYSLKPSQSDIDLTNKLVEGGELLDISVLDHLIICKNGYLSMKDKKYI